MLTIGNWVFVILMSCALAAGGMLLSLKPTFVRASFWSKALLLLTFTFSCTLWILVFRYNSAFFRAPILYVGAILFVGFWLASGYLRRIGIIR